MAPYFYLAKCQGTIKRIHQLTNATLAWHLPPIKAAPSWLKMPMGTSHLAATSVRLTPRWHWTSIRRITVTRHQRLRVCKKLEVRSRASLNTKRQWSAASQDSWWITGLPRSQVLTTDERWRRSAETISRCDVCVRNTFRGGSTQTKVSFPVDVETHRPSSLRFLQSNSRRE